MNQAWPWRVVGSGAGLVVLLVTVTVTVTQASLGFVVTVGMGGEPVSVDREEGSRAMLAVGDGLTEVLVVFGTPSEEVSEPAPGTGAPFVLSLAFIVLKNWYGSRWSRAPEFVKGLLPEKSRLRFQNVMYAILLLSTKEATEITK